MARCSILVSLQARVAGAARIEYACVAAQAAFGLAQCVTLPALVLASLAHGTMSRQTIALLTAGGCVVALMAAIGSWHAAACLPE